MADIQRPTSEHYEISGGSSISHEDTSRQITKESKDRNTEPIERDDLSSTPPPPDRKIRSSSEQRNVSPSRRLLERYKFRSAAAQAVPTITTASPVKASATTLKYEAGRNSAFGETFDAGPSPTSPESIDEPQTPEADLSKEMHNISGVEFEMLNNKAKAADRPLAAAGDDSAAEHKRTTRSQTRRQERVDSHDTNVTTVDFPKRSGLHVSQGLSLRRTTEKELPRTPSPQSAAGAGGSLSPGEVSATPQNSPRAPPAPPPEQATGPKLPQLGLSSDTITGKGLLNFARKAKSTAGKNDQLATSIIPPPFSPSALPGHQWTSQLPSSSRPQEPWGWMKVWTCCSCGPDPYEYSKPEKPYDKPAETTMEQKVCSRLSCGHERCGSGCRVAPDRRFDQPGVFYSPGS